MKTGRPKKTAVETKTAIKQPKILATNSKKRLTIKYLKAKGNKGFSLFAGINRPIISSQVSRIKESIERKGVLRPVLVTKVSFLTGSEQISILDGQHLYNACISLGIEIPYAFVEIENKEDLIETIALLNSSSKTWKMEDYVVAWANIHEDYIKLNKWYNTYNIDMSVLASIMSGTVGTTGQTINYKIKRGLFRVKDEQYNFTLLKQVSDVLGILQKSNRNKTKHICVEYITFVKNCPTTGPNKYNHQKFLNGVKKQSEMISLAAQAESKLVDLFNKIYRAK